VLNYLQMMGMGKEVMQEAWSLVNDRCELTSPMCEVTDPICELTSPMCEVTCPMCELVSPMCEVTYPMSGAARLLFTVCSFMIAPPLRIACFSFLRTCSLCV
jgi:hypothetical protein